MNFSKLNFTSLKFGILLSIAIGVASNSSAQNVEIKQVPEVVVAEIGETFTVSVMLDLMGNPVSVVDIFMNFDSEYLEVQSITIAENGLFNFHMPPSFNNETGKIKMSAFQIGNSMPDDEFAFVEIEFLALEITDFTQVSHIQNLSPSTMLAYAGAKVDANVNSLQVSITAGHALSDGLLSENEYSLELWPNPTSDYAIITMKIPFDERVEITIYDGMGKLVKSVFEGMLYAGSAQQFDLDLENVADGVYVVEFLIGSQIRTEKLMVTK